MIKKNAKRCFLAMLCLASMQTMLAQQQTNKPLPGWHKLWTPDYKGANIEAAKQYVATTKMKRKKTVVVGIIDSGADTDNKTLKPVLWQNKKEKIDGIDNDHNGYVDDVHGWNFLGTRDGKFNMTSAGTEEYREFKRLFPKYKNVKSAAEVNANDKQEFAYYLEMKRKAKINSYLRFYEANAQKQALIAKMADALKAKKLNVDTLTMQGLMYVEMADTLMQKTFFNAILTDLYRMGLSTKWNDFVAKQKTDFDLMSKRINSIEHDKDKRLLMGDDMNNAADIYYGNATLKVPGMEHGTFVASVVASVVPDDNRYAGIDNDARIMVIRVCPDGDEYDKDVATGIRYAVDNGAKVINMSLGKYTSPNAKMVNDAIAYAAKHDVLILAAAGNNHLNIDSLNYYPSAVDAQGQPYNNYIRVGGSAMNGKRSSISNYGQHKVDLYAPGENIAGVYPEDSKDVADGTSVATPVVSAVAAMIRSYYPKLKASQLKKVLIETAHNQDGIRIVDAEAAFKYLNRNKK